MYDPELIFLESLMMNLRTSHIISGKTWIIHRKTYLWKYGPQLLHKLRWWSLFYRERYIRLLLLWTLDGPIQLPVTCQFWFEYPQFSTIEECAPLLAGKNFLYAVFKYIFLKFTFAKLCYTWQKKRFDSKWSFVWTFFFQAEGKWLGDCWYINEKTKFFKNKTRKNLKKILHLLLSFARKKNISIEKNGKHTQWKKSVLK